MSAVARPTFVVVASLLLVHRATANNDDDDDESDEHLSYSVWLACGLFVMPRTVNGTGHTGPSEFCATSI